MTAADRAAHRVVYCTALGLAVRTALNAAGGVECPDDGALTLARDENGDVAAFHAIIAYDIGGEIGTFDDTAAGAVSYFLSGEYHREYVLVVSDIPGPHPDVALVSARVTFGAAPTS